MRIVLVFHTTIPDDTPGALSLPSQDPVQISIAVALKVGTTHLMGIEVRRFSLDLTRNPDKSN